MIENIGQLITELAKKTGIDTNDQHLIDILSNAELTKVPIHSDIAGKFENDLISVAAAKDNHSGIGSVYKAQALAAVDKKVATLMEDNEFSDEERDAVNNETSSYKKLDLVYNTLKNKYDAKSKAGNKADKDTFQKQIDELQNQLRESKESLTKKEQEYKQKLSENIKDFKLRNFLNGFKTIYDNEDPDTRFEILKLKVNKILQDKNAKMELDDKNDLAILQNDGSKLYGENNIEEKLQNVVEKGFATTKTLVTHEQSHESAEDGNGQQKHIIVPPKKAAVSGNNQAISDYNKRQLEALDAQTAD